MSQFLSLSLEYPGLRTYRVRHCVVVDITWERSGEVAEVRIETEKKNKIGSLLTSRVIKLKFEKMNFLPILFCFRFYTSFSIVELPYVYD